METPNQFYGESKEEFLKWIEQRSLEIQIERKFFEGSDLLPKEMPEPPEWTKKAYEKLKLTTCPSFIKAIKSLQTNKNDVYSMGVFMGSMHAFRNQERVVPERAVKDFKETFAPSDKSLEMFQTLVSPGKGWGISRWKAWRFRTDMQRRLMISYLLSTDQAKEFHKGYLKGLDFSIPYDADDGTADRKEILSTLWLVWPKAIECGSVAELHKVLNAALNYQADPEAPPKRLEAICREIGLKLAGRGRPKKS